ncbi:hypothetical protein C8R47DRAFT_188639 [Mycena vitilis]|nr:hypothetical protein C8R47DRAFT_188639 [Mycena vitilis]
MGKDNTSSVYQRFSSAIGRVRFSADVATTSNERSLLEILPPHIPSTSLPQILSQGTSSVTNQSSLLEILPAELILAICAELIDHREALLCLIGVCRYFQQPAAMTYAGLKESDIDKGELTISNNNLAVLPQLTRVMSQNFEAIQKLHIKFSGTGDVILEKIRHLGHLAQFIPSVPFTDFEFIAPDFLKGPMPELLNYDRMKFAAALGDSPLAGICRKLIGPTECGEWYRTRYFDVWLAID